MSAFTAFLVSWWSLEPKGISLIPGVTKTLIKVIRLVVFFTICCLQWAELNPHCVPAAVNQTVWAGLSGLFSINGLPVDALRFYRCCSSICFSFILFSYCPHDIHSMFSCTDRPSDWMPRRYFPSLSALFVSKKKRLLQLWAPPETNPAVRGASTS